MNITSFPFNTFDWENIPKEEKKGESGKAIWQIINVGDIRVRLVEYSAGYVADHWCKKGHVIHCLDGEMETALEDGRKFRLSKGMTYIVGDNNEAHRSSTDSGCRLFIVD